MSGQLSFLLNCISMLLSLITCDSNGYYPSFKLLGKCFADASVPAGWTGVVPISWIISSHGCFPCFSLRWCLLSSSSLKGKLHLSHDNIRWAIWLWNFCSTLGNEVCEVLSIDPFLTIGSSNSVFCELLTCSFSTDTSAVLSISSHLWPTAVFDGFWLDTWCFFL